MTISKAQMKRTLLDYFIGATLRQGGIIVLPVDLVMTYVDGERALQEAWHYIPASRTTIGVWIGSLNKS